MGQANHLAKAQVELGKVSPKGGRALQVNLPCGGEQGILKEMAGMEEAGLCILGSSSQLTLRASTAPHTQRRRE